MSKINKKDNSKNYQFNVKKCLYCDKNVRKCIFCKCSFLSSWLYNNSFDVKLCECGCNNEIIPFEYSKGKRFIFGHNPEFNNTIIKKKCPFCDKMLENSLSAISHFHNSHKKENYIEFRRYYYNDSLNPRFCECNKCNEEIEPYQYYLGRRFRQGHHIRVVEKKPNEYCTKETYKKVAKSNTGRKKTPEELIKISESGKKFYKNETEEQRNKRIEKQKSLWNEENRKLAGIKSKENITKYLSKNKGNIKTSKLEIYFKNILENNGIAFKPQFRPKGIHAFFDFKINNLNVLIECDGIFWHCKDNNPKYEVQKKNLIKDKNKNEWAKTSNYVLLRFWEDDIYEKFNAILEELKYILYCIENKIMIEKSNISIGRIFSK